MNALTVYILVSLAFVIATMIEFAILLFIHQRSSVSSQSPLLNVRFPTSKTFAIGSTEFYGQQDMENDMMPDTNTKLYSRTQKIDFLAFFIFMLSFSIFNTIYFARYF